MADMPWMKFYPADWRSEERLRLISREARSLWLDILCLIFEGGTGRLEVDGRPMTVDQLAKILGDNPRTIKKLMAEIEKAGVSSKDDAGFVISRRIIRDKLKHEKDVSNGRKGGSPVFRNNALEDNGVNPPDKAKKLEARSQNPEERNTEPSVLSKEKRGTRLPPDFIPDGIGWNLAQELGYDTQRAQGEFDNFLDYWRSVPGAKGLKLDWQATFRTWIRRASSDLRGKNVRYNSTKPARKSTHELIAENNDFFGRKGDEGAGGD